MSVRRGSLIERPGALRPEDGPSRQGHERRVAPLRVPTLGARVALAVSVSAVVGSASAAAASSATVQAVSNATYGQILATSTGLPLYTLDTDHGGQSTCDASCLKAWPPLEVAAGTVPTAGPGVPGALGTALQSDGNTFVTYGGVPVYTFAGDSPNDVTGQGVSGFFVVKIEEQASAPTTTTVPEGTAASSSAPSSSAPAGAGPGSSGQAAPSSVGASSAGAAQTGSTQGAPTAPQDSAAATSASAATSAAEGSPSTLASTGPGAGLRWLVLAGGILLVLGALVRFAARVQQGRWSVASAETARRDRRGGEE